MDICRAAIVAPFRTAVGKFGGSLASLNAGERGAVILKALMERAKIDPAMVDDVVFSQGYGNGEAPAIGHWAWLAAGLPLDVPGYQLDRRCGSGLRAVVNAAMMVHTGMSDVVLAGGVESMSNVEYYTIEGRRGSAGAA
jgi:acetyl-CoA C-acetyltransferase